MTITREANLERAVQVLLDATECFEVDAFVPFDDLPEECQRELLIARSVAKDLLVKNHCTCPNIPFPHRPAKSCLGGS